MAQIRRKRIDIQHTPLLVGLSMELAGAVPDIQTYDASTGEYYPDYKLVPLTILPSIAVVNPDEKFGTGAGVSTTLTNVVWRYGDGSGTMTAITAANADFAVDNSTGAIQVRRNTPPGDSLVLEFEADLLDNRTGEIYRLRRQHSVHCDNVTAPLRLELDTPALTAYDPLRDVADATVRLSAWRGGKTVSPSEISPVWEVMRPSTDPSNQQGVWERLGTGQGALTDQSGNKVAATLDYEVEVASDKMSAVIHRDLIQDSLALRVRTGDPADNSVNNNLLLNSAFDGKGHWFFMDVATIDASKSRDGRASVKIEASGFDSNIYRGLMQNDQNVPSSANASLNLTGGTVVTASVWTYTDDLSTFETNGASIEIDCYNANGTRLTAVSAGINPTKVNEWQKFVHTRTLPEGTVRVRAYIYVTRNGRLWVNSPKFELGKNTDPQWTPAPAEALSDGSPKAETKVVRRVGRYEYDIAELAEAVGADVESVLARAVVRDLQGLIVDPARYFGIRWYVWPNTRDMAAHTDLAGEGEELMQSTSMAKSHKSMNVGLEVAPLGPWMPITDSAGNILTDSAGDILVTRDPEW